MDFLTGLVVGFISGILLGTLIWMMGSGRCRKCGHMIDDPFNNM